MRSSSQAVFSWVSLQKVIIIYCFSIKCIMPSTTIIVSSYKKICCYQNLPYKYSLFGNDYFMAFKEKDIKEYIAITEF